jgi:hypothetical protein
VERLDPPGREAKRVHQVRLDRGRGGIDLGLGDAEPVGRELDPVEAARQLDQRRVAAGADIRQDRGDRDLDVLLHLALGGQEAAEARLEPVVPRVKPERHPRPP